MKETICTIAGQVGGFIAAILGGWDSALVTLVVFILLGTTYIRDAVCISFCLNELL